uniref:Uncharacterized protein n=1 Tax=Rhizophora mucronata TaxID=61149 RepID=A0A2P2PTZ1_RHIMU
MFGLTSIGKVDDELCYKLLWVF